MMTITQVVNKIQTAISMVKWIHIMGPEVGHTI